MMNKCITNSTIKAIRQTAVYLYIMKGNASDTRSRRCAFYSTAAEAALAEKTEHTALTHAHSFSMKKIRWRRYFWSNLHLRKNFSWNSNVSYEVRKHTNLFTPYHYYQWTVTRDGESRKEVGATRHSTPAGFSTHTWEKQLGYWIIAFQRFHTVHYWTALLRWIIILLDVWWLDDYTYIHCNIVV